MNNFNHKSNASDRKAEYFELCQLFKSVLSSLLRDFIRYVYMILF